jgi:hypothetical protein
LRRYCPHPDGVERFQPRSADDGHLLISSGFNPFAASTRAATARLMALPANQFLLRHKGSQSYYVYADPVACSCVYVDSVSAMDKYRASFVALPADTLSSGGYTNPEQNIIDSMEQDEAGPIYSPRMIEREN